MKEAWNDEWHDFESLLCAPRLMTAWLYSTEQARWLPGWMRWYGLLVLARCQGDVHSQACAYANTYLQAHNYILAQWRALTRLLIHTHILCTFVSVCLVYTHLKEDPRSVKRTLMRCLETEMPTLAAGLLRSHCRCWNPISLSAQLHQP